MFVLDNIYIQVSYQNLPFLADTLDCFTGLWDLWWGKESGLTNRLLFLPFGLTIYVVDGTLATTAVKTYYHFRSIFAITVPQNCRNFRALGELFELFGVGALSQQTDYEDPQKWKAHVYQDNWHSPCCFRSGVNMANYSTSQYHQTENSYNLAWNSRSHV